MSIVSNPDMSKYLLIVLMSLSSMVYAYSPNDFNTLLKTYVSDMGFVDYDAWKENSDDIAKLQAFVDDMAAYDVSSLSGQEQLAFWINAYNALALHEVLERYPVDTIRPDFLGIPERSFFVEPEHIVGGKNYSLDQIENDVLRKLGEPRIHFAINCASFSCPKLRSEVYTASKLDEQLSEQAIMFINDPMRNQFDTESNTARLSKIFDWFRGDFDAVGGVAVYMAQFARGEALAVLQSASLSIDYLPYDWKLNRVDTIAEGN
jgi:hypothetical protein